MIGETVSHYRITDSLGAGGMGVVYEAEDTRLKRTVALKFLPSELTRDPEAKARFIREAQAASAIDHPNICTIHEIGETTDGRLFIVMARYRGETLRERIERGAMPVAEAAGIIRQVAEGLAQAHARGIVHRDIKPANILVTTDGLVKILDFGLAKLSGQTQLTATGTTLGTASYMAPEQAMGEATTAQSDVWALGAVYYEMLTGKTPFPGEFVHAQIYAILHKEPQSLTELVPALPAGHELVTERVLAKDPQDRFPSAAEFVQWLDATMGWSADSASGFSAFSRAAPSHRGRRRPGRVLAGALAAAVVVVLLYGSFTRSRSPVAGFHERDYLLVTEFADETATANLGSVLRTALTIDIQQSQYVNVFSDRLLQDALERMGKPAGETITLDLGTELAVREAIPLVLGGSASSLSGQIIIAARLLRPETGEVVFATRVEAADEHALLPALDELSMAVREWLGESDAAIRDSDEPLAKVTTTSLDALRLYSEGDRAFLDGDWSRAIMLLNQAAEVDSMFAMAYAKLARIHFYSANTGEGIGNSALAYAWRDRLTQRERLYVEGEYFRYRGQYEAAIPSMTALLAKHPDDTETRANLTATYIWSLQYPEALQNLLAQDSAQTETWQYRHALGNAYGFVGDFEAAVAAFRQAQAINPGPPRTQMCIAWCFICGGDRPAANAALDSLARMTATGSVTIEYQMAKSLPALGRIAETVANLERAREAAEGGGRTGQLYWIHLYLGQCASLRGDMDGAYAAFRAANEISPDLAARVHMGRIEALRGDYAAAELIADDLARPPARSTAVADSSGAVQVRAQIALGRGEVATAVGLLESLLPTRIGGFEARYELGCAQAAAGDFAAARRSFAFITANRFMLFHEGLSQLWPLAEYQLGLVDLSEGRPDDARRHFATFLAIWADADEDLPARRDAERQLAELDRR